MVNLKDIRTSNRALQSVPPGLVAVFVGATAGISLATLKQFAKNVNGPRAYIIGRSNEKGSHIIAELKTINSMGTYVFIEGQVSLIKEVDRICEEIKKFESHIDILCMSPGYLSLGGRHVPDTTEGIETDLALQFYSRQRILINLLPLLEVSNSPRIISILGAGFEGTISPSDLECRQHYNFVRASQAAATMTDLMFEELAKQHPSVSFIHVNPGGVGTHLMDHLLASTPGLLWYLAQIPRYTIVPIYTHFLSTSPDVAGERILFLATSCRYPPAVNHEKKGHIDGFVERPAGIAAAKPTVMKEGKGNGVYRIDWNCETCKESKILDKYRQEGLGKPVFEHVTAVFERAVKTAGGGNEMIQKENSCTRFMVDRNSLEFDVEL
ncbi:hypothetical protein N431DRAFT_457817 [Stipitochalara longipes BDJ]|nr:hypothetical protein N431DRAFT_457817 [Stipitochalara longipes BDJ]